MHEDILTIVLILINLWVTYQGLNDYGFFEKYKFNVGAVARGEYYRLITGGFLHAGWGHLIFNMFTLYFFMPVVTTYFGAGIALLIYLSALIGGNLLSYAMHRKHPWYSAVGNSGAVTGILFASILIYPKMEVMIFPIPVGIPSPVFAVAYLLYTMYGMQSQRGNIGHEAHFGGAGTGMLLTAILSTETIMMHKALSLLLAVIVVGGLIFVRPKE